MKNNIFAGLLLMALVAVFALANYPYTSPLKAVPFLTGADTLGSITAVDSISWQVRSASLNAPGAWNQFSTYITAANKAGEQTVVYALANETNWTYGEEIRIKIDSPDGTLTSGWIYIGDRAGAMTLFVQPDTVVAPVDSTVYKVRLQGQ